MTFAFVFVTCRPDSIIDLINAYYKNASEFNFSFDIFLIEDSEEAQKESIRVFLDSIPTKNEYFTHRDIFSKLGKDSWIFPKKSGACRGFGFLEVYKKNYDVLFTVDDDVWPVKGEDFIGEHLKALSTYSDGKWYNPFNNIEGLEGLYSRGFPYNTRATSKVVLNQGAQLFGPDVDYITLESLNSKNGIFPFQAKKLYKSRVIVPKGVFTTIAYTSVAIVREAIPAYYSQLMGETVDNLKIGRFDDIWSGIFLQKIANYLGVAVSHGRPITIHKKVPRLLGIDRVQELRGIEITEELWKVVDEIEMKGKTFIDCYKHLISELEIRLEKIPYQEYFSKNLEAMRIWNNLCEKKE